MVDAQTLQTASIIITCAGILVAVIYYVLQLRHQSRMRQTDLVMRLYATFESSEFQKANFEIQGLELTTDFDAYLKKYGQEHRVAVSTQAAYYEGIGVLLHRKLIDIGLVDDLLSTPIISTWEKIEPIVKARREQLKRPQIFEWFEYLYNEMQKREQQLAKAK
jgi:hypothetical protein